MVLRGMDSSHRRCGYTYTQSKHKSSKHEGLNTSAMTLQMQKYERSLSVAAQSSKAARPLQGRPPSWANGLIWLSYNRRTMRREGLDRLPVRDIAPPILCLGTTIVRPCSPRPCQPPSPGAKSTDCTGNNGVPKPMMPLSLFLCALLDLFIPVSSTTTPTFAFGGRR
jgi:hypothetical protein